MSQLVSDVTISPCPWFSSVRELEWRDESYSNGKIRRNVSFIFWINKNDDSVIQTIENNYPPYVGKLSFAPNVPRRRYLFRDQLVVDIIVIRISTREIYLYNLGFQMEIGKN